MGKELLLWMRDAVWTMDLAMSSQIGSVVGIDVSARIDVVTKISGGISNVKLQQGSINQLPFLIITLTLFFI